MPEDLSIGLNLTYLTEDSGGSGTYAYGLIDGLRRVAPRSRLVGFVADQVPRRLASADWAGEVEWVRLPVGRAQHPRLARGLWMAQQWGSLPVMARAMRLDVVHGLANVVPPVAPGVATVVTILDVIWAHFPRTMEASATRAMRFVAKTSALTADRVLTISQAAGRDIATVLRVPEKRIDVAYLAAPATARAIPTPASELRAKLGLHEGPIVLSLAQKREHKNLNGLITAFLHVRGDAQLVLPGSSTPHEAELIQLAERLGLAGRVHFPGWLSDADVEGLYASAACLVMPSWIEGFGLPILEAMSVVFRSRAQTPHHFRKWRGMQPCSSIRPKRSRLVWRSRVCSRTLRWRPVSFSSAMSAPVSLLGTLLPA